MKRKPSPAVALKQDLQARYQRSTKGLSNSAIRQKIARDLAESPAPIAQLWRAAKPARKRGAA